MNLPALLSAAAAALQAVPEDGSSKREVLRIVSIVLLLAPGVYLFFMWRAFRPPRVTIRNLPWHVQYELKNLAEEERRSPSQQALVLIEEALKARERQAEQGRRTWSRSGAA